MTATKKQNTGKSVQVKFLELLQTARKLEEKEVLPIVDRKYTAVVDKENLTVTLSIEVPLSDVVRSAKGNNYIIPTANTKGVRGSGVMEFHSEDGLCCKIYADRTYISTQAQEDDKRLKALSKNDSEKALLKENLATMQAQNAMLMKLLEEQGILKK